MKRHYLFIVLIVCCFTISCGNSSKKQQTEVTTQQVNPFEMVFKEACEKKETLYDLIRKDIIKERIIREYSANFYNKALEYTVFAYEIIYKDGKYTAFGSLTRLAGTSVDLIYDPTSDLLTVKIMEEDRLVQSDGEVHYNTEGWHMGIDEYKNDFGEIEKREAASGYMILTKDGEGYTELNQKDFMVVMRTYCITLWTDKFGGLEKVKDIRIKDHDSGIIYNISFDRPFQNEEKRWFTSIGVYMFGENMRKFIDTISSLENYTISIRSDYGNNVIINNPENFNNIKDVYMKLLENQKELDSLN